MAAAKETPRPIDLADCPPETPEDAQRAAERMIAWGDREDRRQRLQRVAVSAVLANSAVLRADARTTVIVVSETGETLLIVSPVLSTLPE